MRKLWGRVGRRRWLDWRWQMANRLAGAPGLAALKRIAPDLPAGIGPVAQAYPFCVTPYYLALCHLDGSRDPLLRQILPDRREMADEKSRPDPLGESRFEPVPGLIHRYRNRAVVLVTGDCAVRCRHCTRKNTLAGFEGGMTIERVEKGASALPKKERRCEGANALPSPDCLKGRAAASTPCRTNCISTRLPAILNYLRRHPQIREVIVSGGDPLLLATPLLDRILRSLRAVESVEVLRIGTRAPVVLPMRVDRELCRCLQKHRPVWINTQFNHPREITPESEKACRMLQEAGLPVSNQAVLMRGVNDSLPVLEALCNGLQRIMVRPYYVFQCDRVRGTRHFRVAGQKAVALSRRLRARLGGQSMPLFVADLPGRKSKVPLEAVC